MAAVEAKDPFTEQHSRRVSLYAEKLAQLAGLERADIDTIKTAALLHDIGKIGIPDAILTKPGKLTREEFALIKRHPEQGVQILEHATYLKETFPLILHHHEHWHGGGYPAGLAGEKIPQGARILQLADAIDAILSERSYKLPMTTEELVVELDTYRGRQFDPELTDLALVWVQENHDYLARNSRRGPRGMDRRKHVRAAAPLC